MTPRHEPACTARGDGHSIFASLGPGERIIHGKDGGHSVVKETPGVPGTIHFETVRRFDADRQAIPFDADPQWRIQYRITGHDCTFIQGRHPDEAGAADAWRALRAERNDVVAIPG